MPQETLSRSRIDDAQFRSDRFLEFLGGAEGNLFARLDLNRLTRRRIAAHASGTVPHLQNSEFRQSSPAPLSSGAW